MSNPVPPAEVEPRIALITGASRGIGLAIADQLSRDGFHVVLTARDQTSLESTATRLTGPSTVIACDLADRASTADLMSQVASRFGRLDVLVNNAGILPAARRSEQFAQADWDRTLEVNLTAPWMLAVQAKALMAGGGVIVNVSSTASFYPSKGLVAYNVSKAGVVMMTRGLALEWARDGIRVVGIAPGKIDTDLLAPIKAYAEARGQQLNPQRRVGHPSEVADLVSFLVSDRAGYITGSTFPIDGGELLEFAAEAR